MSTFDKREEGFERKFTHDADLKFRAEARRNRMLGAWVAGHMGLSAEEAANYARDLIREDLKEVGDEDVFRKLRTDFDVHGVKQSDHQIRRTMDEMFALAVVEIETKG